MYDSKVISAKQKYLRHLEQENKNKYAKRKSKPALWPSDLYSCHRKAAHHVIGSEITLSFSDDSLAYMKGGVNAEEATGLALKWFYGRAQSVSLKSGVWSGRADFVLNHKTPGAVIIEHKATGSAKFKGNSQLPIKDHVGQLGLYGKLYEEVYKINPELVLYYVGWGCEAEFDINILTRTVEIIGIIKNYEGERFVSRTMQIDLQQEINRLESVYKNVSAGGDLPPRLDDKAKGCTFMGKPSCSYFYNCWGNEQ